MTAQNNSSLPQRQGVKRFLLGFQQSENPFFTRVALVIALLGLAVRTAVVVLAGDRPVGQFSGVGDQVRYLTLADSIFQGNGFTYAGQSTGIAVAYVCLLLAEKLFGIEAGVIAGAIALTLPSLVFISAELQTEQLAAFLIILFLFSLLGEIQRKKNGAVVMGITSGIASLIRFNCAILPIIGAIGCLWPRRNLKNALAVSFVAGLIVAPWIVRNATVFHGAVLYSSHGGINLLEGVLMPEGRAQKGESERVRAAVGWLHTDIELNDAHRLRFPSEDKLDKQARAAAIEAWTNLDWKSRLQVLTRKVASFWLSTDQFFETSSFSPAQRALRASGVVAYWIALALALVGWLDLLSSSKATASVIAFYAFFVTAAHLPFVMNTRLRIPFIDPLLAVLAGGGFCFLICKYQHRRETYGQNPALISTPT